MKLSELLNYNDIVVQCHDFPDADAVASAYAVYWYLKHHGKASRMVYSGAQKISKANLVLMIDKLEIPIEYVAEPEEHELVVFTDCQPNQRNVTSMQGRTTACIDHHQVAKETILPEMQAVRSNMGACATILWDLMRQEGINVNEDQKLATALYYGLYMDTSKMQEIWHPLDKDMRDSLDADQMLLTLLRNTNMSEVELRIVGEAFSAIREYPEHRAATAELAQCDPNLLGIAGDLMIEVDSIDACVTYTKQPFGYKVSVRSCVKEIRADELAAVLTFGRGGGHTTKAGGMMGYDFLRVQPEFVENEDESVAIREVLARLLANYFNTTDIIYSGVTPVDETGLASYQKLPVPVGYLILKDRFPIGSKLMARTIEGDIEVVVGENTVLMAGITEEVYPNTLSNLMRDYQLTETPYEFKGDYIPTVSVLPMRDVYSLADAFHQCIGQGGMIEARQLDHRVKVFSRWDPNHYIAGNSGDWLAVKKNPAEAAADVYIINKEVFARSYQPM